jgi:hypothetical protein
MAVQGIARRLESQRGSSRLNGVPDPVRQAYATLGLAQGATLREIKARRKALARQWHPDRFQNDPAGQAEATERMRAINGAYQIVVASLPKKRASTRPPNAPAAPGRPAPATSSPRPSFTATAPPAHAESPFQDTDLDRVLHFCLGATLGGLAAHRIVVLWPPLNDALALGILLVPAVVAGAASARFGSRFLDWLAEPRL